MINVKVQNCFYSNLLEFKYSEFSKDIDPDNHVYSNLINNLNYITQEQLEVSVSSCKGFSAIHFNARSLKRNFDKIEKFVLYCKIKFDVIACKCQKIG